LDENFTDQPLLNHQSEMYNEKSHVRVRILSSKLFGVEFSECKLTKVEQD
jgi:hypothetical protein